jgi:hypothetical protein
LNSTKVQALIKILVANDEQQKQFLCRMITPNIAIFCIIVSFRYNIVFIAPIQVILCY